MKKICSKCKKEKPLSEFYKRSEYDGVRSSCKECTKKYWYYFYQENKEKCDERSRKWQKENKEKCKARKRSWQKNNPEKVRGYARQYRRKNREKVKRWKKIWDKNNKEERKEYREKNKKELREYNKKWKKERRIKNPQFRLNENIRTAISHSLKGEKAGCHWETLVGYTLQDLMNHLEKLFTPEMSWENYGSYWVIDHSKPQSLFHYTIPEDQAFKNCWVLENLQPMEKIANIRKSNKF